jgi:aldose 1-epimerase
MAHDALAAGFGFLAMAAAAPPLPVGDMPFTAQVITDHESKEQVVVLSYRDPADAGRSLEARVAPGAGANLFSLKVGGEELLAQPSKLADLPREPAGTPIMFPTPNRVRNATFTFDKRKFEFEKNSGNNFIHGLVRHKAWKMDAEPVVTAMGASIKLWIDWAEGAVPDFRRFPIPHRLSVTYTVGRTALLITYAVDNNSSEKLPFGFGIHPFFRIPGERKDVLVQVPARRRMEARELLPTGRLLPVAKTPYDLRKPTSLEGLNLDDVYLGVDPSKAPSFELRDLGIEVILGGSREFSHVVLYTPPGKPYFCVENQTSSADAHNLHARGLVEAANLQIAQPHRTARGTIEWRISRTRAASSANAPGTPR